MMSIQRGSKTTSSSPCVNSHMSIQGALCNATMHERSIVTQRTETMNDGRAVNIRNKSERTVYSLMG